MRTKFSYKEGFFCTEIYNCGEQISSPFPVGQNTVVIRRGVDEDTVHDFIQQFAVKTSDGVPDVEETLDGTMVTMYPAWRYWMRKVA